MEVQGDVRSTEGAVLQLDTIRALHQTVVSLRSALEASKSELNELKQKYERADVSTNNNESSVDPDQQNNNVNEVNSADSEATDQTVKENQGDVVKKLRFSEETVTHEELETSEHETTIELESKFDVTIKVSADRSPNPDADDNSNTVKLENMAGSREGNKNGDKFNIQVKITSEENLVMDQYDRDAENMNPETDEISAKSVSEGENSVFSDAGGTLTGTIGNGRRVCEQDSISGNDSEEVDDIELIFTTDEKELTGYQEDLVSITDGENWNQADAPVLLKFNVLDADGQEVSDGDGKKEDASKHRSDDGKNRKGCLRSARPDKNQRRKFESNDSLSLEVTNKSYSFDNTKSSSFDRDSSVDIESRDLSFDHRDESFDQLDVLRTTTRTKYSVYVETDISKCGVMEDDTYPANLSFRRNTCPNPFQYRPLSHRDAVKGTARPLLTPAINKGPRRSSAAQTDISALPNHWRSDTHLAKKILPSTLTTLPGKTPSKFANLSRLAPPAPIRPKHISEESRRVMLSDIGFTSMVPELSRSAEPIWGSLGAAVLTPSTSVSRLPFCCTFHATPCYGSVPSSPTRQDFKSSDPKYWSRSSIQRSVSGRMGDVTPGTHRVSFIDQPMRGGWRGSLPELRKSKRCCMGNHRFHKALTASKLKPVEGGESGDSTEELLDEAERFLRCSMDCMSIGKNVQDDFIISRWSRPYLPTVPRQLRLGHLVKVIAPHGRIALGKVRYVGIAGGPVAAGSAPTTYVGIQLKKSTSVGGDGSFQGRRYFHCEPGFSLFVPFSKVVVAWAEV